MLKINEESRIYYIKVNIILSDTKRVFSILNAFNPIHGLFDVLRRSEFRTVCLLKKQYKSIVICIKRHDCFFFFFLGTWDEIYKY